MPPHFGAGGVASIGAGLTGAAPGAAAAPGSINNAGAYTPDWKSLIANDPGLLASQSALSAGDVSSLQARNAAIQNAYITFGGNIDIPTLAKQLGMPESDVQAALGPDTQKLAQENTSAGLSTEARLGQANDTAIRQIKAALNKRGILNSGEAGYQLDQQNLGYRQAESDATQKLLGYLQQYQQGYASAQQQSSQSLAQAYSDAANRQFADNQSTPGATATLDHIDASGQPVYKAPDGSLYLSDGSAYTAPSAPQSQPMSAENTAAGSFPSRVLAHLAPAAAPAAGGTAVRRLIGT